MPPAAFLQLLPLHLLSIQALGSPRVALLFLTRGDLPHHETWRLWFGAAAGMLPVEQLRAATCPAQTAAAAAAPAAEEAWRGRQLAKQPGELGTEQWSWQEGLVAKAAACGWNASSGQALQDGGGGPIQRQHLFSVYIHAPPNVTGGCADACSSQGRPLSCAGAGRCGVRPASQVAPLMSRPSPPPLPTSLPLACR